MTENNKVINHALGLLKYKLDKEDFVVVRGEKTVELLNYTMTFNSNDSGIIDLPHGFATSKNYVTAEIKWYDSMSIHIDGISNHAKMWGMVCDKRGSVNSNYGYLIYSPQNGYQYDNVLKQLKEDPQSRRAVMYYANPMMHYTGGSDHVCTMYVSYTIRKGKLIGTVSMRSSDIRFGIIGADLAWQIHVMNKLAKDLGVESGDLHWHAASLHLYERHFTNLKGLFNEA